jgi:hypothetical protein
MPATKKQKDFVRKCGEYASEILLLNSFGRTFNWMEEDAETVDGCNKTATMTSDLKYKELVTSIYPCFWNETESQQFEIIFHEFCHVHTEHQYLVACDFHNDRLVTRREVEKAREYETALFEKAFIWLLGDPKRYKEVASFIKGLSTTKRHAKKT